MREMIKPTLSLFIICLVVAFLLAVVNFFTKDVIAERALKDAEDQRKTVFVQAESFEKLEGWESKTESTAVVKEVYRAIVNGQTVGFVFGATPKGYGGEIKITVGISIDGKVTGVSMGDNKETPGLGSKANEPKFIGQFNDKPIGKGFEVVKGKAGAEHQIEAISGATISSKAVTQAVSDASVLAAKLIKEGVGK